MNINTRLIILTTAMLVAFGSAEAAFYKSVDENGNIVYSDTPTPGAEQLTPPMISTVESRPKAKPETTEAGKGGDAEQAEKKPPTKYTRFRILQPKNNDAIWDNTGSVPLTLALEPKLDTENGHTVWVYVDGKAVVRRSQSLVQPLTGIERGLHKIRAEIRDAKRKTLKRTKTITIQLHRVGRFSPGAP